MSTDLQEDLAEAIVKNKSLPKHKRKNKKELLVSIGYAATTAEKEAKVIIESKGVQDSLSHRGLDKELITSALVYDIENKPKRRERELRLGAEILGLNEHSKDSGNKTLVVIIAGESAQRYAVQATQKSG